MNPDRDGITNDSLETLAGKAPDAWVAERSGVTVDEVKVYRRTHGIAPFFKPPPGKVAPAGGAVVRRRRTTDVGVEETVNRAPAPVAPAAAPSPATPSWTQALAPHRSAMGKVPDAVIAERAGVDRNRVVQYRQAHGISVYTGHRQGPRKAATPNVVPAHIEAPTSKGTSAAPTTSSAPTASAAPTTSAALTTSVAPTAITAPPESSPAPTRGRVSKLTPWLHLIGISHDEEIARLAGVLPGSVKVYRWRHSIPAGWLQAPAPAPPPVATPLPPAPEPEPAQQAPTRHVEAPAPPASPAPLMAWRVVAEREGERRGFIVVAADIAVAVERAVAALDARSDGPWVFKSVGVVAEALG